MFCVTRITVYVSMCFGEFAGYLCGCNLGLELTISAAAVARGWTSYVATLFRAPPDALRLRIGGGDGEDGDGDGENTAVRMMLLDVPAAAIVAGITWMLIRGMKDTARFNTVVTVVSLIVIGFVIVAGGAEVDSNNWYVYCNLILVCARAIRLTYSVLFQDPVRAQRSRRRPRRRVRRVLQLRGVRYRRDVRGGMRQPGAGFTHRHHGIARHMRRALRGDVPGHHRDVACFIDRHGKLIVIKCYRMGD